MERPSKISEPLNVIKINPQTLKNFGNKKRPGDLNECKLILTQLKTKKSKLLDDDRLSTQLQNQLSFLL